MQPSKQENTPPGEASYDAGYYPSLSTMFRSCHIVVSLTETTGRARLHVVGLSPPRAELQEAASTPADSNPVLWLKSQIAKMYDPYRVRVVEPAEWTDQGREWRSPCVQIRTDRLQAFMQEMAIITRDIKEIVSAGTHLAMSTVPVVDGAVFEGTIRSDAAILEFRSGSGDSLVMDGCSRYFVAMHQLALDTMTDELSRQILALLPVAWHVLRSRSDGT